MAYTIELETGIVDAYGILPDIPGTIEVHVTLDRPEIWSMNCNTVGYGQWYVDEVEFDVNLSIGSIEASRAFEKFLATLYATDKSFKDRLDNHILEDVRHEVAA